MADTLIALNDWGTSYMLRGPSKVELHDTANTYCDDVYRYIVATVNNDVVATICVVDYECGHDSNVSVKRSMLSDGWTIVVNAVDDDPYHR